MRASHPNARKSTFARCGPRELLTPKGFPASGLSKRLMPRQSSANLRNISRGMSENGSADGPGLAVNDYNASVKW
jgi:hypothetical protein